MKNNYYWQPKKYVWLKVPGGLSAWQPEELNKYIDRYNKTIAPFVNENCFFNWLSYETNCTYYHIFETYDNNILQIKGA